MLLKQLLSLTVSGAVLSIPSQLAILILGFFLSLRSRPSNSNCWRKASTSPSSCHNYGHWARSPPVPAMAVSVGLIPPFHFMGASGKTGWGCAVKHPGSPQAFPQRLFFGRRCLDLSASGCVGCPCVFPAAPGALPHSCVWGCSRLFAEEEPGAFKPELSLSGADRCSFERLGEESRRWPAGFPSALMCWRGGTSGGGAWPSCAFSALQRQTSIVSLMRFPGCTNSVWKVWRAQQGESKRPWATLCLGSVFSVPLIGREQMWLLSCVCLCSPRCTRVPCPCAGLQDLGCSYSSLFSLITLGLLLFSFFMLLLFFSREPNLEFKEVRLNKVLTYSRSFPYLSLTWIEWKKNTYSNAAFKKKKYAYM